MDKNNAELKKRILEFFRTCQIVPDNIIISETFNIPIYKVNYVLHSLNLLKVYMELRLYMSDLLKRKTVYDYLVVDNMFAYNKTGLIEITNFTYSILYRDLKELNERFGYKLVNGKKYLKELQEKLKSKEVCVNNEIKILSDEEKNEIIKKLKNFDNDFCYYSKMSRYFKKIEEYGGIVPPIKYFSVDLHIDKSSIKSDFYNYGIVAMSDEEFKKSGIKLNSIVDKYEAIIQREGVVPNINLFSSELKLTRKRVEKELEFLGYTPLSSSEYSRYKFNLEVIQYIDRYKELYFDRLEPLSKKEISDIIGVSESIVISHINYLKDEFGFIEYKTVLKKEKQRLKEDRIEKGLVTSFSLRLPYYIKNVLGHEENYNVHRVSKELGMEESVVRVDIHKIEKEFGVKIDIIRKRGSVQDRVNYYKYHYYESLHPKTIKDMAVHLSVSQTTVLNDLKKLNEKYTLLQCKKDKYGYYEVPFELRLQNYEVYVAEYKEIESVVNLAAYLNLNPNIVYSDFNNERLYDFYNVKTKYRPKSVLNEKDRLNSYEVYFLCNNYVESYSQLALITGISEKVIKGDFKKFNLLKKYNVSSMVGKEKIEEEYNIRLAMYKKYFSKYSKVKSLNFLSDELSILPSVVRNDFNKNNLYSLFFVETYEEQKRVSDIIKSAMHSN